MSALPISPPPTHCPGSHAAAPLPPVRLHALTPAHLDAVLAVEQSVYSHPWSRGHFMDSLRTGHQAQCLMLDDALVGYFIAMPGYKEVHLLNLTVAPDFQRQGWARVLLDALVLWSRACQAEWLWLEVRVGNTRAQQIYLRHGFDRVGLRRSYYPSLRGEREDAAVMRLRLEPA
ncbi:MAG: ribosomal protein S18-alanine N-acetyltransferase [Pseudomonadota bacterium]|nr:ribosomal protein S18-alanine N-acetyltransferase [Pseudomonadota bacterium]